MIAQLRHQGTHPRTVTGRVRAHLSRLAAVLVAVTCGLLASATAIPAAFAKVMPPGPGDGTTSVVPRPATTVHVITTGGMAGWQIALIALGAALVAACAAVLLDRVRIARRSPSATTA